jgi:hypothetical protein
VVAALAHRLDVQDKSILKSQKQEYGDISATLSLPLR